MKDVHSIKGKIALLKRAPLFSTLKKNELVFIAQYSEYYNFPKDKIIFKEGNDSQELCIIDRGEVLITKRERNGRERDLARFIKGECFGEMDLLEDAPRSATATAVQETTLLVFPDRGVRFKEILQNHPEIFASILHKLLAMIAGRIRSTNRLISEKTPWIQDLRRQMLRDKLTELYNRSFLEEDFASLLPEYGKTTSLIMLKPDNFKEINDTFGHEAGDKVLRLIADTIQSKIRGCDVAVRYKGDEFAAIFPDTNIKTAVRVAEDVKNAIGSMNIEHITRGEVLRIRVSIGVANYPDHAADSRRLTIKAHETMLDARKSGGNRVLKAS